MNSIAGIFRKRISFSVRSEISVVASSLATQSTVWQTSGGGTLTAVAAAA